MTVTPGATGLTLTATAVAVMPVPATDTTAYQKAVVAFLLVLLVVASSSHPHSYMHSPSHHEMSHSSVIVGTLPGGYIQSAPLPRLQTDLAHHRPFRARPHQSPRMSQERRQKLSQKLCNNIISLPEQ
jgi:hypothetical protein